MYLILMGLAVAIVSLVPIVLALRAIFREQLTYEQDLLELFEIQERLSNSRFQGSVAHSLNQMSSAKRPPKVTG